VNAVAKPFVVLLVEDDPADASLVKRALRTWERPIDIHHVVDGLEFLKFLRHEGSYATAPRPDIVLLDLNMPRMDGHEALKAIRADAKLQHLVVVVMTTSSSESDVARCYQAGANSFITKPVDLDRFLEVMRGIELYWASIARLPG
jgi:CheY-like chemotaxis protein